MATGSGSGVPASGTAYASTTLLRQYLPQLSAGEATDGLLTVLIARAQAIVDGVLGFSFAAYGASATAKDVLCPADGTIWHIPYHSASSVTTVYEIIGKGTTGESTSAITEFDELDDGRLYYSAGWTGGTWYRISAKWGYGTVPDEVVEVTLELAVNLWRGRDRGLWSDVVGAEGGGAVGYARALTNQQRMILRNVRTQYAEYGFA